jgi:membrane-associated phospholipid phosphatase
MKKIFPSLTFNRFGLTIFVSTIVLCIGALFCYYFIDDRVISWISSNHKDLNSFAGAKLIKILGKACVPLWLLFLWGFLKNRLQLVLAGSLSMLLALAIVGPGKILTHRERPRELLKHSQIVQDSQGNKTTIQNLLSAPAYGRFELQNIRKTRYQSFPSGDTATVFAPAVTVVSFVSALSLPILFILAAMVGSLTVAGLSHYPSDIFAGAAVGIFSGWLALQISSQWISQNSFRINEWWRKVVLIGLILLPLLSVFSGGFKQLLIFLASSAALTGCVYVANKVSALWQKNTRVRVNHIKKII